MCIRDRLNSWHFFPFPINPFYPFIGEFKQERELFEPLKTCLLYTSDAADERSSVDLGGRRIIKKTHMLEMIGSGRHQHKKMQTLTLHY